MEIGQGLPEQSPPDWSGSCAMKMNPAPNQDGQPTGVAGPSNAGHNSESGSGNGSWDWKKCLNFPEDSPEASTGHNLPTEAQGINQEGETPRSQIRQEEASSQPTPTGVAGPSNAGPSAQDQGVRANSPPPLILHTADPVSPDDPIHREVCRIIARCDKVQDQICEGTRIILDREGVILKDPEDISKIVEVVLTDRKGDIDDRLAKLNKFRRYLGKKSSKYNLLPEIKKELRDWGNNLPDSDSDPDQ